MSGYSVTVQTARGRGVACVRAHLPIRQVSRVFGDYLNQVYAAGRNGALPLDGQNIFVYRGTGAEVDVELGVGVTAPFVASGAVTYATLPVGEVATVTHWGDYARLGDAHGAILDWCQANGRATDGTRWEIYGHWQEGVTPRTDVYYLLKPAS